MPLTLMAKPASAASALASYAAHSGVAPGTLDTVFFTLQVPDQDLRAAASAGHAANVQTVSFGAAIVDSPLETGAPGETSIDGIAGIIQTTQGQAGATQSVHFASVLAAPGMQTQEDYWGQYRLQHRYAVAGHASGTGRVLTQYEGQALSGTAGWWLKDGEASTAFDLTNVVSKAGGLLELGLGWDRPQDSAYFRLDAGTGVYELVRNAAAAGYYGRIYSGDADFPAGIPANSLVQVGEYRRSASDVVHHTIDGNGGDDSVLAGASAITFHGGAGDDSMSYAALGAGSSISVTAGAVAGSYAVVKTLNNQEVFSETAVTRGDGVNLRITLRDVVSGEKVSDALDGVENIIGTSGNDVFKGGDGKDVFTGLGGNDRYSGANGNDHFYLGSGNNSADGGAGVDTADYSLLGTGIDASITAQGSARIVSFTADGKAVRDTLTAIEEITATKFADTITVNATGLSVNGGAGDDTLVGNAAGVTLDGGLGFNTVRLNSGGTIYGDAGQSTLIGGGGADRFVFDATTLHDHVRAQYLLLPLGGMPNRFEDSVEFRGLKASQLYFGRADNDLVVQAEGTNTQVVFDDWFAPGGFEVSTIGHFEASNDDGSATLSLSHQDVVALVAAWGAAFRTGGTPDVNLFWH